MSPESVAVGECGVWAPEDCRAGKPRLEQTLWSKQEGADLRAPDKGWLVSSKFGKALETSSQSGFLREEEMGAEKALPGPAGRRKHLFGEQPCYPGKASITSTRKANCAWGGRERVREWPWWHHPTKGSPTKWASFIDDVMSALWSVQTALGMSSRGVRVPSITCCRCSVLHASLFTSRFTKQTWERGQKQPSKWKPGSSFPRKQESTWGGWFESPAYFLQLIWHRNGRCTFGLLCNPLRPSSQFPGPHSAPPSVHGATNQTVSVFKSMSSHNEICRLIKG